MIEFVIGVLSVAALLVSIAAIWFSIRRTHVAITEQDVIPTIVSEFMRRMERVEGRIVDTQVRLDVVEARLDRPKPLDQTTPPDRDRIRTVLPVPPAVTSHHGERKPIVASQDSLLNATEVAILRLIAQGERSPKGIQRALGKSREHTARSLKHLYERGLVSRREGRPYIYEATEKGLSLLTGKGG